MKEVFNMKKIFLNRWVLYAITSMMLFLGASFAQAQDKTIILATTTSTQDSGLLDVLIPVFEKKTGYFVKTIAVGSGQAMAMGQKGEADVLLVHSPAAEKKFVEEGYGINRRLVMHNDFIILGPVDDPAKIKGTKSSPEAFKKIASAQALFLSRGDNSGTHAKEKDIWKAAGLKYEGEKWYQQTGLGMGQTLNVAAEKKGYTLADRGTYLAMAKTVKLDILVQGDATLLNIYHVIEVNPAKWPKVNAPGGKAFADFMVSKETQDTIRIFGVDKFGSPLFFPDAGKNVEGLGK
jgi:tungstate transport system substrate-binding protein